MANMKDLILTWVIRFCVNRLSPWVLQSMGETLLTNYAKRNNIRLIEVSTPEELKELLDDEDGLFNDKGEGNVRSKKDYH